MPEPDGPTTAVTVLGRDVQRDPVERRDAAVAVRVGQGDLVQVEAHRALPSAVRGSTAVMRRMDRAAAGRAEDGHDGDRAERGERLHDERHAVGHEDGDERRECRTESSTADEHDHGLPERVLEQIGRRGAESLEDRDVAAALDRPHGEESADDHRRDDEEEAPHQLERAVLGLVGPYGLQRPVDGPRLGARGPVRGAQVGAVPGAQGDHRGLLPGALPARRHALPVTEVDPDDGRVTVRGVARDRAHREGRAGQGDTVTGPRAQIVRRLLGQDGRAGRRRVGREPRAGPHTERGHGRRVMARFGVDGVDSERLRAVDPRARGERAPLPGRDRRPGERHRLAVRGPGEGQTVGGQPGQRRGVVPGQARGQAGQQADKQRDQHDHASHQREPALGEP